MCHRESALLVLAVLALGCRDPNATTTPEPSDAPASSTTEAGTDSLLSPVQGAWTCTYTLTWMDPETSSFSTEPSEGTATIEGDRIEYTWTFRGDAQTGTVELSRTGDGEVRTRFVDSWHTANGEALTSKGTATDGVIDVLGHYDDWGWRTEVLTADPDRFVLRMYNITPEGQEMIAVDCPCQRTQ